MCAQCCASDSLTQACVDGCSLAGSLKTSLQQQYPASVCGWSIVWESAAIFLLDVFCSITKAELALSAVQGDLLRRGRAYCRAERNDCPIYIYDLIFYVITVPNHVKRRRP